MKKKNHIRNFFYSPAVFTYGAWINNRSLFPCQEPPSAMATWEAFVTVDDISAVVLMSGDEEACIKKEDGNIFAFPTVCYNSLNAFAYFSLCIAFQGKNMVYQRGNTRHSIFRLILDF